MTNMKKIIATVLALMLLFTWSGVAAADGIDQPTEEDPAIAAADITGQETPDEAPTADVMPAMVAYVVPDNPGKSGTTLSADVSLSATHTRTWSWDIEKTGVLDRNPGEYYMQEDPMATYTLTLTKSGPVIDKTLSGTVTVTNGGAVATEGLAIHLTLYAREGNAWVEKQTVAANTASYPVLAPGETHTYAYTFSYDAIPGVNYKADSSITITNHSGHLGVPFGPSPDATRVFPEATEIHASVRVSDTFAGDLGQYSDSNTILYPWHFGPNVDGDFTNTASINALDDGALLDSDSATVTIVRINTGKTRTIGYWKTHAGFGPQRDVVTDLLPVWLGTSGGAKSIYVTTAGSAVSYLSMSGGASNGIVKLYAQLLAAKLNIKNGASNSAVASVIAAADTFLATKNAADWDKLSKADKNMVLGWMTTLDQYNNGIIGPGHAD